MLLLLLLLLRSTVCRVSLTTRQSVVINLENTHKLNWLYRFVAINELWNANDDRKNHIFGSEEATTINVHIQMKKKKDEGKKKPLRFFLSWVCLVDCLRKEEKKKPIICCIHLWASVNCQLQRLIAITNYRKMFYFAFVKHFVERDTIMCNERINCGFMHSPRIILCRTFLHSILILIACATTFSRIKIDLKVNDATDIIISMQCRRACECKIENKRIHNDEDRRRQWICRDY